MRPQLDLEQVPGTVLAENGRPVLFADSTWPLCDLGLPSGPAPAFARESAPSPVAGASRWCLCPRGALPPPARGLQARLLLLLHCRSGYSLRSDFLGSATTVSFG